MSAVSASMPKRVWSSRLACSGAAAKYTHTVSSGRRTPRAFCIIRKHSAAEVGVKGETAGVADAVAPEVEARARCAIAGAGVEVETAGVADAEAPEVRVRARCAIAEAGVEGETPGVADAEAPEVRVRARCVAEAGVEVETAGVADAEAPEVRVAACCAIAEAEVGVEGETVGVAAPEVPVAACCAVSAVAEAEVGVETAGVADAEAPEVMVRPGCWSGPAAASCCCSSCCRPAISEIRAGFGGWRAPIHAPASAVPSTGPPMCPSRGAGISK